MTTEAKTAPALVIGDRIQISVELIRQIEDDWANGNIITVCVADIVTGPDGLKVLYLQRVDKVQA